MSHSFEYEMIYAIVNAGFADAVMEAAREYGARGGTVIHARGTANGDAEQMFGITVQPEKEIVMIIVPAELRNDILHTVYQKVGLKTPGQGIAFSLPVEEVVGFGKEKQLTADGTEE